MGSPLHTVEAAKVSSFKVRLKVNMTFVKIMILFERLQAELIALSIYETQGLASHRTSEEPVFVGIRKRSVRMPQVHAELRHRSSAGICVQDVGNQNKTSPRVSVPRGERLTVTAKLHFKARGTLIICANWSH